MKGWEPMQYPKQIDLCQFVAHHKGIFFKAVPQPFCHIQQTAGLPGHICKTFCGDIGYIHRVGITTDLRILARRSVEICIDCKDELMSRLTIQIPKQQESVRQEEAK